MIFLIVNNVIKYLLFFELFFNIDEIQANESSTQQQESSLCGRVQMQMKMQRHNNRATPE